MFSRLHRFDTEHRQAVDALVAVILALLLGVGFALRPRTGGSSDQIIGALLAAAAALPLAVRRRNPYVALVGSLVFTVALYAFSVPDAAARISGGDRPLHDRDRRQPAHHPSDRLRHARGLPDTGSGIHRRTRVSRRRSCATSHGWSDLSP